MARRSTKRPNSFVASSPKRSPGENLTTTRLSKRTKRSDGRSTTPQRSKYFKDMISDGEDPEVGENDGEEASDFEDDEYEEPPIESESELGISSDENTTKGNRATAVNINKPGEKRFTKERKPAGTGSEIRLTPGTQLITKKPKAREAGSIPYRDRTIHPNTFMFLVDLTKNNDRHWLKMNDLDYRQSLHDFNSFLECLTQKIIKADETIPELPVKDIIFRIYRDVRFSKDPTPYKTHFSAAWSRTGRKGPYAGYYLHVQPGKCFVGSGVWLPEADKLAALRRDVDRKPHRLKNVLLQERIRSEILTVNSADEKKVVRTFVSQGMNKESALRTKPKGYENDHENIELLRLRNFTISKKLADKEVLGDKALERISFLISCMVPFVTYLNSIIMPDDPEESSSEDEDEVEDEGT